MTPNQGTGVHQVVDVYHIGDRSKKVESIKFMWKMTYRLGAGELKDEMGKVAEFSLA